MHKGQSKGENIAGADWGLRVERVPSCADYEAPFDDKVDRRAAKTIERTFKTAIHRIGPAASQVEKHAHECAVDCRI